MSGIAETLDETNVALSPNELNFTYYYNQHANGTFLDGATPYLEMVNTRAYHLEDGVLASGADGFCLGCVSIFNKEIEATGLAAGGGESIQVQGFYIIGPAGIGPSPGPGVALP